MDARGRNGYRGVQQASSFNGATIGVSASTVGGLPGGSQVRQHDGNDLNNINVDHWGTGPFLGTTGDTTTRYSNDNVNSGTIGRTATRNGNHNSNNTEVAGRRDAGAVVAIRELGGHRRGQHVIGRPEVGICSRCIAGLNLLGVVL